MQIARRLSALLAVGCLAATAVSAGAAEVWSVQEGRTSFHFNTELMASVGLSLTGVEETASAPAEGIQLEGPFWHFRMTEASHLTFEVDRGVYSSRNPMDGYLVHEGGFSLRDLRTGTLVRLQDFEIVPGTRETAVGAETMFRLGDVGEPAALDLIYGGINYRRGDDVLHVFGFDVRIGSELARSLGRPDLDGQFIGTGEFVASAIWTDGDYSGESAGPNGEGTCNFRDVKLGILDSIGQAGRDGSYPTGVVGLSMATTSCNVGNCDIEWYAPMQEDHPGIAMHLYRETNGVLEQIGISDIKHGFFALSSSQCTSCQNPSNGTFLGVGCSDTYGFGNNSDRQWLAPRAEWESFPGTWTCDFSHFAGEQAGCSRRHGSSGHTGSQHRLQVPDARLDVPGNFYYESYYVVRDDDNKINNLGWRPCTVSRSGNTWNFSTGSGYPVNEGPLVDTWGDVQSQAAFTGDGLVKLSSKVIDLGGGQFQYEYAVFNFDSDRQVKSFRVPVGTAALSNIGFNDPNLDDLDAWLATVDGGYITWTTDANPIQYGQMYNFRFTTDVESENGNVQAGAALGGDESIDLAAVVPGTDPAGVEDVASSKLQLRNTPNPLRGSTQISFELAEAGPVSLEIYDASGRLVRSLVSGSLGAGPHQVEWDAKGVTGDRVHSGVYYYRLKAGDLTGVRSLLVLD